MPQLFILAGCNGAGKTTTAKILLPEFLGGIEFVNADIIAANLNPDFPESVAFQAGRIMLERVDVLLSEKSSFALETTLATKSYVGLTKKAQSLGYEVVLMYFWLESCDMALKRVAKRVREGGHFIPDEDVKRRYEGGIRNLVDLSIRSLQTVNLRKIIFSTSTRTTDHMAVSNQGVEISLAMNNCP